MGRLLRLGAPARRAVWRAALVGVAVVGLGGTAAVPASGSQAASAARATPATPAAAAAVALAITQPTQPTSGPGGSDYAHGGMTITSGGSGNNAWFVFQPSSPRPASAPVAIMLHGYGEFSGHGTFTEFIRHEVRKGNVVIYPRWQTSILSPCLGPFNIEPCMTSALNGIRGGLSWLQADPANRVQPQLDKVSYFGFSFGGIITANLANRHVALGLPTPRAIFLDDPHDGGLAGAGEPALDDSLAGIPAATKINCHSGSQGVIAEAGKAGSSCNAVYTKLGHIPQANRDLVMTRPDNHGTPALSSAHGVCSTATLQAQATLDAYDWNFCWKVFDALQSSAYFGTNGQYALGDTPEHRSHGLWSDGVPVVELTIQEAAPLVP
jgi:hypothetical protein